MVTPSAGKFSYSRVRTPASPVYVTCLVSLPDVHDFSHGRDWTAPVNSFSFIRHPPFHHSSIYPSITYLSIREPARHSPVVHPWAHHPPIHASVRPLPIMHLRSVHTSVVHPSSICPSAHPPCLRASRGCPAIAHPWAHLSCRDWPVRPSVRVSCVVSIAGDPHAPAVQGGAFPSAPPPASLRQNR